jgi:hypothetical protein
LKQARRRGCIRTSAPRSVERGVRRRGGRRASCTVSFATSAPLRTDQVLVAMRTNAYRDRSPQHRVSLSQRPNHRSRAQIPISRRQGDAVSTVSAIRSTWSRRPGPESIHVNGLSMCSQPKCREVFEPARTGDSRCFDLDAVEYDFVADGSQASSSATSRVCFSRARSMDVRLRRGSRAGLVAGINAARFVPAEGLVKGRVPSACR